MKKNLVCLLITCSILSFSSSLKVNAISMDTQNSSTISIEEGEKVTAPIPKLAKLDQISPNQIEITYDNDVDVKLGVKPSNYWVQSLCDTKPKGIASLGKTDKVNSKNSLTDKMVKIEQKPGSLRTFVLTFNDKITKDAQYKLIICYVTAPGAEPYNGDNGSISFMGK